MIGQTKHLFWLVVSLIIVVVLLPSSVLAQNFSVSPAEVSIADLSPGEKAEFTITIHNKDDVSHVFELAAYNPEKSQLRSGRAKFPDDSWIRFSPQQVEMQANSEAVVKVMVNIPPDSKWVGEGWEIWLAVVPESSDLLTVKLYVRLLVSTSGETGISLNPLFILCIVAGGILLYRGIRRIRRRRFD